MTLPVRIEPEARDDLAGFEPAVQSVIDAGIQELEEQGLDYEKVHFYEDNRGRMIYRLRLKDDVNHVVFFDIHDGAAVVYGIYHRRDAYDADADEELGHRIG